MRWPELVLRHKHAVLALLAAVMILGVQARFQLPVQLFPDTNPPTVTVITEYPGMAAEDVDLDLTKLLEEEFTGLDGVTRISSTSQTNLSVIRLEFQYDRVSALAAVDVQNAVGRVRRDLPAAVGEPQVLEFSTSDKPIITVALSSPGTPPEIPLDEVRELADNEIRERIQRLPGIAAVDVFGGSKRELHVAVHRDRLESLGLDFDHVVRTLRNWNISAPGGRIEHGGLESVIRFEEPIRGPEDARGLVLVAKGDQRVFLGDVADVRFRPGEDRSAFRHDGRPAIAVQVIKRDEANTVETARLVREALAELRLGHPGVDMAVAGDDSEFTERVIADMTRTVFFAVLLTVLIVFLFLANLRQAAIIALSIPTAFLATFSLMQLAGLDLNMVTMSALVLAIGLLVDDGIVILENIHRQMAVLGKAPRTAAVDGVSELFAAKLGGTLTTLGVLLPLMFLGGFIGKMFGPLSMTLAFALASSFFISVTLIPLLGAYWLKPPRETGFQAGLGAILTRWFSGVRVLYLAGLRSSLRHPRLTLILAAALLIAGLAMLRLSGSEMLPRFDSGSFRVLVDLAPGTPLEDTLRAVNVAERFLVDNPVVLRTTLRAGHEVGARAMGDRGAMGVNQAEFAVDLTPRTERLESQWQIMDQVRRILERTPGVTLGVPKEMGGTARASTSASIVVRVSGNDPVLLDRTAKELLRHLGGVPGISDLYANWSLDTPQIKVHLDHQRVAELGLTGSQAARIAHQALDGQVATNLRQSPRRDLDIVVRYAHANRQHLEDLENILLNTPRGPVPLREIARLEHGLGPRILTRENGQRTVEVHGFHFGRPLSEVVADVSARLREFTPPPGYQTVLAGEQSDFAEARARMLRALALAGLAVYLILVIQFSSFKHPLTVMSAIPLQFTGVGAALIIAGKYVSMPALLGIILLVGIVVNNAIILLDLARGRIQDGLEPEEAVIEAVSTRFRPIMMTSLSTIAGMLPLALEMAVGAERFSPIATVIIGGVTASTVLTLIVIPTLFVALEKRDSQK
ncbi:efflux RND transporter permease subunit [Desulfonatronum lacustre]|uniref:efflux RND transporter permease subunit n=1 Tax=Desulfonatronum lacustre TaxID=66849 RepID=UPI00048B41C5|nr:efflux RND transporter permease subunit [Desulfonatronum lacustre]